MTERRRMPPDEFNTFIVEPDPIPASSSRLSGRLGWILALVGLLLLLGWAAIKGFRTYQAAQGLLALQTESKALLVDGPMNVAPDDVLELVTSARADIDTLSQELAFLDPLSPVLGKLPKVGPLALAAPSLLAMAEAGSEAADVALQGLAPALAVIQQEDFGANEIGQLLPIIQAATPQLEAASQAMDRYGVARSQLDTAVDVEALPWRVRQLITLADEWVPAGQTALELAPQLPLLLGINGPQRYLIMAQNEDELRSTGGFLTGAGVLTVENGRILDLALQDSNGVDNWRDKPYDAPPQPYYDFMLSELFLFRDSNYWPDFPTSAQKAMDLYAYGQDESGLTGAIAIDQEFMRLLVDATGPVAVEGGGEINANNLIRMLHDARDPEEGQQITDWMGDRKAFLGGFAGAIRSKLESDFSSVNPLRLAQNMKTALDQHHLQVYVHDPVAEQSLSGAGWDGSLPTPTSGDFWMVVDTNMGFNKANYFVNRAFDYSVDLTDATAPAAHLTTTYTHSGEPSAEPCYQGAEEEYEQGAAYLAIANKCYWNYVRVYVPAGSGLTDSSRHIVPADSLFSGVQWDSSAQQVQETDGLTTFSNFMLVTQGASEQFFVAYMLPTSIVQPQADGTTVYELRVQKQAGTRPEPLHITVTLPDGARLLESNPDVATQVGNQVTFDTTLESNAVFRLRYR